MPAKVELQEDEGTGKHPDFGTALDPVNVILAVKKGLTYFKTEGGVVLVVDARKWGKTIVGINVEVARLRDEAGKLGAEGFNMVEGQWSARPRRLTPEEKKMIREKQVMNRGLIFTR